MQKARTEHSKQSQNRTRFVRLAEARVTKAIRAIRLIGNLSNRNNYSFDQGDAQKIVEALDKELKGLKRKFEDSQGTKNIEFKLSGRSDG
jgi:hypothetical protein